MGPDEIQQTVAQATSPGAVVTFEWLFRVILMPLIFGGYAYTWISTNSLRKELRDMKDNHIASMNKEIAAIKARLGSGV